MTTSGALPTREIFCPYPSEACLYLLKSQTAKHLTQVYMTSRPILFITTLSHLSLEILLSERLLRLMPRSSGSLLYQFGHIFICDIEYVRSFHACVCSLCLPN